MADEAIVSRIATHRAGPDAAQSTLAVTRALLDAHPHRITGTPGCLSAGRAIADLLRPHCDRVAEERFILHPGSLWNVGRVIAAAYFLSLLLWIGGGALVFLSVVVSATGLVYGVTHYIRCGDLFDRFFPAAEGCNVAGVIEPASEARQQVLVVGHHDAPYVLSYLLRRPKIAGVRLLLGILTYFLLTAMIVAAAVAQALGFGNPLPLGVYVALVLLGLVLVAPMYGLITRTPSPGAGDNLNASVMAVKVAEHFAAQRRQGTPLQHTRLIVLSTDGEEAGQRGAIAYAKQHRAELRALPTFVLNVDSVYRLEDLAAVTRDRSGTVPLSALMARECRELAAELGYSIRKIPLPFGGGGTDAAAFAQIGVEATSLIGLPTALVGHEIVYHTPRDTVDQIEPAAVQAVLDLAANYVLRKDGRAR